jgi:NAD(P)-dependent dehydrogenase (short-subunit alcohol dehydrogenase family)
MVVSGCDSGIGRATALHLASKGFHVVVTVLDAKAGESLQQEAEGQVSFFQVDITNEQQVYQVSTVVSNSTEVVL